MESLKENYPEARQRQAAVAQDCVAQQKAVALEESLAVCVSLLKDDR
ncbi:MAG TPA: hypothetical protein VIO58_02415 [Candidatus Methanoperedens sp.]